MNLIIEFLIFLALSILIVVISKFGLVKILRKLGEALNLKPKTIGNIAGIATSVPELLTVSFSAIAGLTGTSIYNIISSNVINFVQYVASIYLNKNQKAFSNKGIKMVLILVFLTILIPVLLNIFKIAGNIWIVLFFVILLFLFLKINKNAHKMYLQKDDKLYEKDVEEEIEKEKRWVKGKKRVIIINIIFLIIITVALYIVGNLLSDSLTRLCNQFNIPEFIMGVLLGFITSIPELITFFESQKHYKKSANSKEGVIEATNNLLTSNMMNLFIIYSIGILLLL